METCSVSVAHELPCARTQREPRLTESAGEPDAYCGRIRIDTCQVRPRGSRAPSPLHRTATNKAARFFSWNSRSLWLCALAQSHTRTARCWPAAALQPLAERRRRRILVVDVVVHICGRCCGTRSSVVYQCWSVPLTTAFITTNESTRFWRDLAAICKK